MILRASPTYAGVDQVFPRILHYAPSATCLTCPLKVCLEDLQDNHIHVVRIIKKKDGELVLKY
jgi:hypothetical protein